MSSASKTASTRASNRFLLIARSRSPSPPLTTTTESTLDGISVVGVDGDVPDLALDKPGENVVDNEQTTKPVAPFTSSSFRQPHNASIFVANLPTTSDDTVMESMLREKFTSASSSGTVIKVLTVKLVRNLARGQRTAFIQCENAAQVEEAIAATNDTLLGGALIRCEPAKAHRSLFVSFHRPGSNQGEGEAKSGLECVLLRRNTGTRRIEVLTNDDARSANEITLVSADSSLREAVAGERLFVAFDPSGGALIQNIGRIFSLFGPLEYLHPHHSSWPPQVFQPHPPPLPLYQHIESIEGYCGPWEAKFENRDDAVTAKRTLEHVEGLSITWAHFHTLPRGYGPYNHPQQQHTSFARPSPPTGNGPTVTTSDSTPSTGLLKVEQVSGPADTERLAAEVRDSFKFAPHPKQVLMERRESQRQGYSKDVVETPAQTENSHDHKTTTPDMTEVEFPPLSQEATVITAPGEAIDGAADRVGQRQTFAKAAAPFAPAAQTEQAASTETPSTDPTGGGLPHLPSQPHDVPQERTLLYIPHLLDHAGWSKQRLYDIFSKHEGFQSAALKTTSAKKRFNRQIQYGAVDFDSQKHAEAAIQAENGREYHGTVLQIEFHRAYKAKPRSKAGKVQRPDEIYARLVVHGEERAPEAAPSAADQNVAAVSSSAIAVDDELTPVGDTLPAQVEDRRNRASGNQPSVGATGVPLPKLSIPPSTSSPTDIAGLSRNPSRPIILGTPMRPSLPSKLRGLGFRHRSLSDSHARAEEPLAFLAPRATQDVTAACQADHTLALRENSGMTASSSGSSLKTGTTSVTGGGRRVVSWSPAMNPEMSNEDSEVSSPDVNSVSSEGGAMGERQTVVTAGPWPYGGVVYSLPSSDQSFMEGRQGPQAKAFVETEHGLLPVYSTEALAPYAHEPTYPYPTMSYPAGAGMSSWIPQPYMTHPWGAGAYYPYASPPGPPSAPPPPSFTPTPPLTMAPTFPSSGPSSARQQYSTRGRPYNHHRRNGGSNQYHNHRNSYHHRNYTHDSVDFDQQAQPALYYHHPHQHNSQSPGSPPQYHNVNYQHSYSYDHAHFTHASGSVGPSGGV